jgi:hypothetical protein
MLITTILIGMLIGAELASDCAADRGLREGA